MDYQKLPLRELVERLIAGDERAVQEFERRWEIPWDQLGSVPIHLKNPRK